MALFVKSRRPSFPPVPSSEGQAGRPSSKTTRAASIQARWGPRQDSAKGANTSDFNDLNSRSAAASSRLKEGSVFRAWAAAR